MVNLNDDINNDEIDIKTIIKFFVRNKINFFKIFSLLFVSSIFGISQIKPTYEGNLKLEINREIINKENGSTNIPLGVKIDDKLININLDIPDKPVEKYNDFLKEKKFLLTSASILKPIIEAKASYINKIDNFDFDNWIKSNAKIEMKNNILSLKIYGKNKQNILEILSLINKKYKEVDSKNKDFNLILTKSPTITGDKNPRKTFIYLFGLICSFGLTTIILFFKEKISGTIYELNELKNNFKLDFLETIAIKNADFNKLLIRNFLENKNIESNINAIFLGQDNSLKRAYTEKLFSSFNIKLKLIDIKNEHSMKYANNIIIFIANGEITYTNIESINNYLKIYKEKVMGWIHIE